MENKAEIEKLFCKLYTEFNGEKLERVDQLTQCLMPGGELMEFCEFYASQQKPDIAWLSSEEAIKDQLENAYIQGFCEREHTGIMDFEKYYKSITLRIQPSDQETIKSDNSKVNTQLLEEVDRLKEQIKVAYRCGESGKTYFFEDTTCILPRNYEGIDG